MMMLSSNHHPSEKDKATLLGSDKEHDDDDDSSTDDLISNDELTRGNSTNNELDFIRRENRTVAHGRIVLMVITFLVGLIILLIVSLVLRNLVNEHEDELYDATSQQIITTFQEIVTIRLVAMTTLTSALTSHGKKK
jgi:hypothetical protein